MRLTPRSDARPLPANGEGRWRGHRPVQRDDPSHGDGRSRRDRRRLLHGARRSLLVRASRRELSTQGHVLGLSGTGRTRDDRGRTDPEPRYPRFHGALHRGGHRHGRSGDSAALHRRGPAHRAEKSDRDLRQPGGGGHEEERRHQRRLGDAARHGSHRRGQPVCFRARPRGALQQHHPQRLDASHDGAGKESGSSRSVSVELDPERSGSEDLHAGQARGFHRWARRDRAVELPG